MDEKTLLALLIEATSNLKHYKLEYNQYDNSEDGHQVEHWESTVKWLQEKLSILR